MEQIELKEEVENFQLEKELERNGINFVAIDLETATFYRESVCEIGIAVVEDGKVIESKSWLVKPPKNEYYAYNIAIHGIKPEDTENKPEFCEVWKEVLPYIEGRIVVAHNTSFDMYVLRDAFNRFGIPFPSFVYFCSYRMAKSVLNCYNYSLDSVCEMLDIKMEKHHRAKEDAEACARVFVKCIELAEVKSFQDLMNKYKFKCGRFDNEYFRPQRAIRDYSNKKNIDVSKIVGDPSKIDEGSYFYEKVVCFTGKCMFAIRKELLQMVADIGGIPVNSVTASTNILVVGQQDYRVVGDSGMSSKQKKAMELKDKGQDIEIMSEADFLSMIGV